ncbi:unnamed protein product [Blepharisma stoltei]|uniref:Uncharacterized protein n=1 Tax=Blepharisma stoltei TaxID=1481888 RepID=A0AAU9ISS0_9CILI|nr:unnamed protein product [Blepharisma stoltei]
MCKIKEICADDTSFHEGRRQTLNIIPESKFRFMENFRIYKKHLVYRMLNYRRQIYLNKTCRNDAML